MATALTTALGSSEIIVGRRPRQMTRSLNGYAGANGLTGMNLGTRGYQVPILLTLRGTGSTYAVARAAAETLVTAVEALQALDAADYAYGNVTYTACIFEQAQVLPGPGGNEYRWTGSECLVRMSIVMRALV